jgi:hypothetical protein
LLYRRLYQLFRRTGAEHCQRELTMLFSLLLSSLELPNIVPFWALYNEKGEANTGWHFSCVTHRFQLSVREGVERYEQFEHGRNGLDAPEIELLQEPPDLRDSRGY